MILFKRNYKVGMTPQEVNEVHQHNLKAHRNQGLLRGWLIILAVGGPIIFCLIYGWLEGLL